MISLKELQMLAEAEYSVDDTRLDLDQIVDYFCSQEQNDWYLENGVVITRDLPLDILKEHRVFYVDEDLNVLDVPELFKEDSLGFITKGKYFTFSGRIIYPVIDNRGHTMGFCAWDKFVQPKYLDSHNYGYTAKQTTLYGMERLPEYYRNNEPVYLVEGIVCCLYLRSKGFQALALLGSSISPYVIQILRRFGKRLIIIPDNDVIGKPVEEYPEKIAGEHLVRQCKKVLPLATVIQSRVAKDVDDTRKCEDHQYEEQFLNELRNVALCPFLPFNIIRVR